MYDVVVVGLGAMGSATLRALCQRDVDALGVDMHQPPHTLGSSHGHSRVFRTAYFEHPAYVPLLLRARELWSELETETSQTLFRSTGCLTMGPRDHVLTLGVQASVAQYELPHELLGTSDIEERFGFSLNANDIGVYEHDAGLVEPEKAIAAMLDGLPTRQSQVTKLEVHADHVVVHADQTIEARRAVVSVGAWLARGVANYQAPLTVMRQVQHWFQPVQSLDALPCFIHVAGDMAVYGLPPHKERGIKVCRHYGGQLTEPDALDRTPHDNDEHDVRAWMEKHLPAANGALEHAAVCMYGLSPDSHFVIGAHPAHENVILAGGFSGHGFKMAPVIGEVLAQLAIDGRSKHDISLFDPNRFANPR